MRRVTIAVIGNAKTTRANVEALISDVVDSVDEANIALVFDQEQSDGQIWAHQWANEKQIPVLVYGNNDYASLLTETPREDLKFFVLWDDEDPACQLAASVAQEASILAYDLTDGLIIIPIGSEPILRPDRPKIPEAETVTTKSKEIKVEVTATEEPSTDYDSEYDLEETLTVLVSELGKIFARSFATEFKKIIKG
ncbi:MAG: hypothetical protein EBR82_19700 [Caulobacteraceae bacterium]|nr:hypothetical protein [Caulobacteraceae bacterium]